MWLLRIGILSSKKSTLIAASTTFDFWCTYYASKVVFDNLVIFQVKLTFIKRGPTEIWTRIIGFRVQGANHYTIGPLLTPF